MPGFKILIADDDPLMTSILSSTLSTRGYTVTIARDAMQAVMFAVQQQPDVVLLDINMPAGTGLGALKRLKASARTSGIPVVVLSGSTDLTLPATVRSEGAKAFFKKPVDLEVLCVRLDEILQAEPKNGSHTPSAS
ncbi:MAG: response regulator [Gemmatimonadales bacterium]|jgi:two-component system chemotaxis response regulator CheY